MVKEDKSIYQCEECGFHYRDLATAEKCEAWCLENQSCNIVITKDALENSKQDE